MFPNQGLPTFLSACFAALLSVSAASLRVEAKQVLGYYTDDQSSYAQLTNNAPSLTQVATDVFAVTSQGGIDGTAPTQAMALCHSQGIETYACCSNNIAGNWNAAVVHDIVGNVDVKATLIDNLYALVQGNQYTGVNIDFEGMLASDRADFTSFVHDLAARMHGGGYKLIVSAPAKSVDDPNDTWSGAFDFAALGQDVDVLQLMTYDENGPWGSPGPVAGVDWVEAAVQYAVSVVSSAKVSLGLPAYGYDWDTTHNTGASVAWSAIPDLIAATGATPVWDTTSASPHFTYQAGDGSNHEVWYEDSTSIGRKVSLVNTYNLVGVSVWAIGLTDQNFWSAISSTP